MARTAWRNLTFWGKIASNIKSVRKWRKLTDLEVSKKTGIDLKRYRKMERGQTESLTVKELISLVTLFDVYQEEILPDIPR